MCAYRVLIVTGGQTPQVVSETVFALTRRSPAAFVPDKIICVVTEATADRFRNELPGRLSRMAQEWCVEAKWGDLDIQVPRYTPIPQEAAFSPLPNGWSAILPRA